MQLVPGGAARHAHDADDGTEERGQHVDADGQRGREAHGVAEDSGRVMTGGIAEIDAVGIEGLGIGSDRVPAKMSQKTLWEGRDVHAALVFEAPAKLLR